MPYVRRQTGIRAMPKPRGFGDVASDVAYSSGFSEPQYNANGQYIAGTNEFMDFYCNSFLGQFTSPQTCGIPTTSQQAQMQATELAPTAAPADVQAAAVAAGSQSVAEACASDPTDCAAQNAAAASPILSSLIGPSNAASMLGIQPDGSTNLFSGWGLYAAIALGLLFVVGGQR